MTFSIWILASVRHFRGRIVGWLEQKLEGGLELTLNRTKTRIVQVEQGRDALDFLGDAGLKRYGLIYL